MIDEAPSRGALRHKCVVHGFQVTLSLIALAMTAWLTAPDLLIGFQAAAAEVDAIGAPAPLGFADIIGRVKPAVVGVRVRIEEAAPSEEPQQKNPFPPVPRSIVSSANLAFRFQIALLPSLASP